MKKISLLFIIFLCVLIQKSSYSQGCSLSVSYTLYPDNNTPHLWYALLTTSGDSPPVNYIFDWGDGSFPTGFEWSHTYNTPGYYNICVTISDVNGCTANYCDASTYVYKTDAEIITVNMVNQLPTGILESRNTPSNIYPNPATSTLTIQNASGLYHLSDITGKTLLSGLASGETFTLDISALSSGVYFLTLSEGGQQVVRKVIKQ